jgi:hypothetical protein
MGYTGPGTRVGGANTHVETRKERVRVVVGESVCGVERVPSQIHDMGLGHGTIATGAVPSQVHYSCPSRL